MIFKFVNIVQVSVEGGMIREKSRSLLGKKYRSLIDPRSFRARCDVFAYSTLLRKPSSDEAYITMVEKLEKKVGVWLACIV